MARADKWQMLFLLSVAASALTWLEMGVSQTHTPYLSRMMLSGPDKGRFDGDWATSSAYLILGMCNGMFVYQKAKQQQQQQQRQYGAGWDEL